METNHFELSKNKTEHCFIASLHVIFKKVAEDTQRFKLALQFAMKFASPAKLWANMMLLAEALENRLEDWLHSRFLTFLKEAKALRQQLSEKPKKRRLLGCNRKH